MPFCKLCGVEKKLIKAHIIPESLYPFDDGPARESLIKVTSVEDEHRSRSAKGEYDIELVCEACERLFSPWDNYAHDILLRKLPVDERIRDPQKPAETLAYNLGEFDYSKMKLFFISLLWRASASSRPMFSNVNTGPHEERLRKLIMTADPSDPENYAIFLCKFDHPLGTFILNPQSSRFSSVRFYQFYLGGYIA